MKDRVWKKLQGWKEKVLSPARKDVLIKLVLQAIPTYAMQCFLLPKRVCDELDAMIRKFSYRKDGQTKGICWKKWQSLCCRKLLED